MPDVLKQGSVTFRDSRGFTKVTKYYLLFSGLINPYTSGLAINNGLAALSNAAVAATNGVSTMQPQALAYGSTDDYQSVYDVAVLTFTTATGSLYTHGVPAPKAAIFLADRETVDVANSDVAFLASVMIAGNMCGRNADVVTSLVSGRLQRRSRPGRLGTLILDPSLTGPGW